MDKISTQQQEELNGCAMSSRFLWLSMQICVIFSTLVLIGHSGNGLDIDAQIEPRIFLVKTLVNSLCMLVECVSDTTCKSLNHDKQGSGLITDFDNNFREEGFSCTFLPNKVAYICEVSL